MKIEPLEAATQEWLTIDCQGTNLPKSIQELVQPLDLGLRDPMKNNSLSSTASQGTSNIPFPCFLVLGCNCQAKENKER